MDTLLYTSKDVKGFPRDLTFWSLVEVEEAGKTRFELWTGEGDKARCLAEYEEQPEVAQVVADYKKSQEAE